MVYSDLLSLDPGIDNTSRDRLDQAIVCSDRRRSVLRRIAQTIT